MRMTTMTLLALSMLPAAASAEDMNDTFVCVTQDLHVCKVHEECRTLHPVEMNAVDFWKFDLKEKKITARRYDGSYVNGKIASSTSLKQMILLQGTSDTSENFPEGIAWSVGVHKQTGRMSVSVSAHEEVVAVLGSCHAL